MSDRENITDALDARFFAPLRRPRTWRVGVSLDVRDPKLRPLAFDGNFGLEREALRVTEDGHMAGAYASSVPCRPCAYRPRLLREPNGDQYACVADGGRSRGRAEGVER